ncbi:unnamed protein product [Hymenolepis diminuta]|uniref:Uncharacterized protein n=1 Tax=Hymenolepis diminuta TaxID=6216 RepID=A0A564YXG0_HYMDI|nr:unnamed protein product [Hymenolepis diminuta]
MVLPLPTPAEADNDDMKLGPSVRDIAKVMNLTHCMESSLIKIVPARPASEPTVPKLQSLQIPVCLITIKIKSAA